MLKIQLSRSNIPALLRRSLVAIALATGSTVLGVAPHFTEGLSSLTFQSAAYAQSSISQQEVMNFARAVLAMEPLRQAAYDDIKRIVGSSQVPNIICNQPSSFSSLPGNARQIAVNYCNKSREFVRSNNLTVERFNQITAQVQSNADLKRRVQNAMIELQR